MTYDRRCRKLDAAAVRALRPDVLITDELVSDGEMRAAAACVRGGVEVIASAHCRDIGSLRASPAFALAVRERIFERYVVLQAEGIGRVAAIYDGDLRPVQTPC